MKRRRGIFITFEGIDGCGKSTQARRLYNHLKATGRPVLFLREPGGTKVSEKIRKLLLDRNQEITPLTELFLYEAARAQLAESIIIPELNKGKIVICDRYYDSTTAYQGYGRGLDKVMIGRLNKAASIGVAPDLTFIFDVDYKTSFARRGKKADRMENENRAFFNRVRQGFKKIAKQRRAVLLDGRDDVKSLSREVTGLVERFIHRRNVHGAR